MFVIVDYPSNEKTEEYTISNIHYCVSFCNVYSIGDFIAFSNALRC